MAGASASPAFPDTPAGCRNTMRSVSTGGDTPLRDTATHSATTPQHAYCNWILASINRFYKNTLYPKILHRLYNYFY